MSVEINNPGEGTSSVVDSLVRLEPGAPVVVALSGGVDSAVSAWLLKEQGYDVQALFMKNWEEDDDDEHCAAADDLADAERVCTQLDIPLNTVNLATEYWDLVFVHFLEEHEAGRTPNPDVLCNREIKFREFISHAKRLGGERVATGHYARLETLESGRTRLLRGLDNGKDQSYFLYTLDQQQLSSAAFPLGNLCKSEVRERARQLDLAVHDKKDSTGICFIGERPFKTFLSRFLPPKPGDIETPEGDIVGAHDGLMYYTLGQRRGLGIGGRRDGDDAAWYVVAKELQGNVLVVAQGHDHPLLYSDTLIATDIHWINETPPTAALTCTAKTRYRQPDQPCEVQLIDDKRCRVVFETRQRAVTPGQSVVFYAGEECLGGGIIEETSVGTR